MKFVINLYFSFYFRTPIITTKPSEDHTYSAGGGVKSANGVSTVNVVPVGTEPIVNFNGNSTPPTHQVQIKFDSHPLNNHGTEIIIDNRHHSDNMSNGTSSDAAYESSEER